MNNEQGSEPTPTAPSSGTGRSRWTVEPGSVSDSLTFRRPEGIDDPPRRRRPASEIIRELQDGRDDSTQVTKLRPAVPEPARPAATSSTSGTTTGASSTRSETITTGATKYASPRTEGIVAVSRASSTADRASTTKTEASASAARIKPDLGERRELRAATGGSTSPLIMAGFGGVILVAIGGIIGAILDYLFVGRIGVVTTIGLSLAAVVAALVTRKRDLVSIIVAPPIVFALIAAVVLLLADNVGLTTVANMATRGFPPMALATGLAAIIAGARLATSKVGDRR